MEYAWDKYIKDYSFAIARRRTRDGKFHLDHAIDNLAPLRNGTVLLLSRDDIGELAWKYGFHLIFRHDKDSKFMYGWEYLNGKIEPIKVVF
jgi:hypothetical protein